MRTEDDPSARAAVDHICTILEQSSSLACFPDIIIINNNSSNTPTPKQSQHHGRSLSCQLCVCAEAQTHLHRGHQRKSPAEGEGETGGGLGAHEYQTRRFLNLISTASTGVGEEIHHLEINLFPKSTKINIVVVPVLFIMMEEPVRCVQGFSNTTGKGDIRPVAV